MDLAYHGVLFDVLDNFFRQPAPKLDHLVITGKHDLLEPFDLGGAVATIIELPKVVFRIPGHLV